MIRALLIAALLFASPLALAQRHGPPPAGPAHFDVYADGDAIHLLTGVRDARSGLVLSHRRSTDGGATWSEPVRIDASGGDVFAPHPGENPQVAARGDDVLAVWNAFDPAARTRGPLVAALSRDGGRTWHKTAAPDAAGAADYHPLPELAAGAGRFHAVWLHGASRETNTPQGVHYATSRDGATWSAPTTLDALTCECCWNRVVTHGDDVAVLYRGGAPRDMRLARADGGTWRKPVPVGDFRWDFQGCPHVGGGLANDGAALHALVWTGKDGHAGLHYLRSTDGGAWTAPARIGDANAQNGDIAVSSRRVTVVWDGKGKDAVVRRVESTDGGATWSEPEIVSAAGAVATDPRVVATKHGVTMFWYVREHGAKRLVVNGKPLAL